MVPGAGSTPVIPSIVRPSSETVATRLGDEIVLVHLKTERMHVLNPTGARLWELLCAGGDWTDIRSVLLEEFDVTAEQLDAEVEELLRVLSTEQLIELRDEQAQ